MDFKELFKLYYNITDQSPWVIDEVKLSKNKKGYLKSIDLYISFKRDFVFKDSNGKICPVEAVEEKVYEEVKILGYDCLLFTKIPVLKNGKGELIRMSTPFVSNKNPIQHGIHHNINKQIEGEISNRIEKKIEEISAKKILLEKMGLNERADDLLGIVPEIVGGYLYHFRERQNITFIPPKSVLSVKDCKGVLLCHALSPFSESIGFYCELGRAFRISKGLNRRCTVLLAGEDWGKLNWVVKDLGLEDNLSQNEKWRIEVYKSLNIDIDLCHIESHLTRAADDYVEIVKRCWGDDVIKKKFSKEEAERYLAQPNIISFLIELGILKGSVLHATDATIKCIIRKFLRLDKTTFTYFLSQYFHQSKYNGWFKVTIEREKDFDDSFSEISTSMQTLKSQTSLPDHLDLAGLYFEDYVYGVIDDNGRPMSLTAHPYYFPSANIFHYYKDDLDLATSNCLMIYDLNFEKIKKHLLTINSFQKARLIADLLSFAHSLSNASNKIIPLIYKWMHMHEPDGEFSRSWDFYVDSKRSFSKSCNTWKELLFTNWDCHSQFEMPYHFLPYFWHKAIDVNAEAELILIIITEAANVFSTPVLTHNPLKNKL